MSPDVERPAHDTEPSRERDLAGSSPPRRWIAPLLLAALVGGLYFIRLGQDLPLRTHEALLAESARNMYLNHPANVEARPVLLTGTSPQRPSPWLVPNFNDVPRLRKTPLPYWTVAGLAYVMGGVDEWTARLPSAAAAAGTVFIIVALMRRRLSRRAAYLGGATLAASVGFVMIGRQALADMPMTFFTTASLAALWMAVEKSGRRRFVWLLLTGAAGGMAMLAKGPAPLVVFAIPYCVAAVLMMWGLLRPEISHEPAAGARSLFEPAAEAAGDVQSPQVSARREEGSHAEWLWTLGGAAASFAIFIAITAPWPVAVYLQVPDAWAIWKAESFDRSVGDFGHEHPIYYYLARLPILLAPWTIFFIIGIVAAIRRAMREKSDRRWLLMAAAWLIGPLAGFSLAVGKQDHYILPILPAAAIFTALALEWLLAPPTEKARTAGRRILISHGVAAVVAGMFGIIYSLAWMFEPEYAAKINALLKSYAAPEVLSAVFAISVIGFLGGSAVCFFAPRRLIHAGLAALAATFAVAYLWSWPTLQGPMDRAATAADFGRQVRTIVGDAPVYAFVECNHTVIFYAERAMPEIPAPPPGLAFNGKFNPNSAERGWLVKVFDLLDSDRPWFVMCTDKRLTEAQQSIRGLEPILHQADPWRPDEGFWLLKFPGAAPTP